MKKLISIGVALALLAMVVVPVGVAAQEGCPESDYTYPTTYAKIPFAIIESGFSMVSQMLVALEPADLGIPTWLAGIVDIIGPWAGGPLSWTVDMLGWGLSLMGTILDPLAVTLGIPTWVAGAINDVACGLFQPFSCNVSGTVFTPCGE